MDGLVVRLVEAAAIAVPLVFAVACASKRPPDPASAASSACRKLDPALATLLGSRGKDDRVRVVVELSKAPRVQDLLQAGVTACMPSEPLAVEHGVSPDVSWGNYEIGPASALPVTCVGWATRKEIARWCADPTFRSIDAWR
jgi:hypothetical protein